MIITTPMVFCGLGVLAILFQVARLGYRNTRFTLLVALVGCLVFLVLFLNWQAVGAMAHR